MRVKRILQPRQDIVHVGRVKVRIHQVDCVGVWLESRVLEVVGGGEGRGSGPKISGFSSLAMRLKRTMGISHKPGSLTFPWQASVCSKQLLAIPASRV